MRRLIDRLKGHAAIGLDTPVFIYHLEAQPRYLPLTQELFAEVQAGEWTACTSTITLMELTVRPWQLELPGVAREYEALLVYFPHLTIADVTRDVARQAAQLRARYRLRPVDAIQAATAMVHRATVFVTNDATLARLAQALDVVLLDDL
jgi:predicted nucleic acid-binding protein